MADTSTVVLTGATGYLGSHLAHAFLAAGHNVAMLKRAQSDVSRVRKLLPDLQVFDIEAGLEVPFRTLGHVNAVVHTATCYGRKGESALQIFEANAMFPLRLLAVATSFRTELFFNTDSILSKDLNAYALSKHHFAEWGKYFAESGKIKFVNIKLEHIYGAGDDPSKFATELIRACLSNTAELKLTLGEQRRDFVHIDDVVGAFRTLLAMAKDFGQGFSEFGVGTGNAVSIREFASAVRRLVGSRTRLVFGALPYREHETMHSEANVTALRSIGWSCLYDVEAGLKQVIEAERFAERD